MKKKLIVTASIILTCAYPCLFIYFQNVGEGDFHEVMLPFCIFLGVSALVTLGGYLFLRNAEKAALFTCLFMLMFMNFNMVNTFLLKINPVFKGGYMLVVYLVCYTLLFIYLKKSKGDALVPCAIIVCVCGALILLNGAMAIPDIIKKTTFNQKILPESSDFSTQNSESANVYYFVFDEYGGPLSLEHYYEFENEKFMNFLEEMGFQCSRNSYNMESINTVDTLPNILNLNYVTEIDGASEYNMQYTENPVLYQLFHNMGYRINLVNHRDALETAEVNVISRYSGNDRMDTISDYILNQSLVYNMILRLIPERSSVSIYAEALLSALNDMKYIWQEAAGQPTLSICYLQCPHAGFVFDGGGNRMNEEDALNWEDKSLYIEQLKFLNEWIEETIKLILENDPGSVIVMQSDHGVRYAKHCMYLYEEQEYDAEVESSYMKNILNCVYWGNLGRSADIEGLSGINTWRTVLNVMFGYDYELLPEPEAYVYHWRRVDGVQ